MGDGEGVFATGGTAGVGERVGRVEAACVDDGPGGAGGLRDGAGFKAAVLDNGGGAGAG